MKVIPYFSVGDINLKDDFQSILSKYPKNNEGSTSVLGKKCKTIYLPDYDIHIVFSDYEGTEIESIEIFKGDVFLNELDILNTNCLRLKEYFAKEDEDLILDDEGFTSPKFGIGIYWKNTNIKNRSKPTSLLVFNRKYLSKEVPSPEDIIKYYLGSKKKE